MRLRRPLTLTLAASLSAVALGACGGEDEHSATDKATGLTVSVAGDQVQVKRTKESQAGTGGKAGQVSCTDDYARFARSSELPAPTTDWYAATLITWPAEGKESSATLSHSLDGRPDLCVAQSTDQRASAIVYFDDEVKSGVEKIQADTARKQQAEQAEQALQAAAQIAVSTVADGRFPPAAQLVTAIKGQGLQIAQVPSADGVTQTGTIYLLADETTTRKVVFALKGTDGKVQVAVQRTKGSPSIRAAG